MRVLHLLHSHGLYGAESIVLDLMKQQELRGWDAILGSMGRSPEMETPFECAAKQRGLTLQKFPMRRGINLVGGKRIVDYARRHDIDLIHSHGYKGNIIVGLLPRSIRSTPLLITLHGWRPHSHQLRLIQWIERFGIYRADQIVAVHAAVTTDPRLVRLERSRLSVICNGITPVAPRPSDLDSENSARVQALTSHQFAIAAIGRLSAEKGFDLLLRSLARLRAAGMDATLVIFGEGEKRAHLQRLIGELQLDSYVCLAGYVPVADSHLSRFNCLAIASTAEACPLVALEGMRAAVPVVASDAGGLPSILEYGRCGLIFPMGDMDGLQSALRDVSSHPQAAKERVATARIVVREKYTSERMEQEYANLYGQLRRAALADATGGRAGLN